MSRPLIQGKSSIAIAGILGCLVGIGLFLASEPGPAVAVTVSGVVTVLQMDDFENDETRRIYQLEELSTGKRYTLSFAAPPPPGLLTGDKVLLHGMARGDQITVEREGPDGLEVLEAAALVSGSRKAIVLVVDFVD